MEKEQKQEPAVPAWAATLKRILSEAYSDITPIRHNPHTNLLECGSANGVAVVELRISVDRDGGWIYFNHGRRRANGMDKYPAIKRRFSFISSKGITLDEEKFKKDFKQQYDACYMPAEKDGAEKIRNEEGRRLRRDTLKWAKDVLMEHGATDGGPVMANELAVKVKKNNIILEIRV